MPLNLEAIVLFLSSINLVLQKAGVKYCEEIQLDLSAYKIVIVNPGIHVDTGRAFLDINPALPEKSLKEIIQSSS